MPCEDGAGPTAGLGLAGDAPEDESSLVSWRGFIRALSLPEKPSEGDSPKASDKELDATSESCVANARLGRAGIAMVRFTMPSIADPAPDVELTVIGVVDEVGVVAIAARRGRERFGFQNQPIIRLITCVATGTGTLAGRCCGGAGSKADGDAPFQVISSSRDGIGLVLGDCFRIPCHNELLISLSNSASGFGRNAAELNAMRTKPNIVRVHAHGARALHAAMHSRETRT